MGCFTAPAATAAITTIYRKKIPAKYHIEWFNTLVWGATAGLVIEHIASGEIVPYPPFFTAMANPQDMAVMLGEIASIGIPMLVASMLIWAVMVYTANHIENSVKTEKTQKN